MPFSHLGRLVLRDLLLITSLAVAAVSTLFVMGGAMVEANKIGLEPSAIVALIPYLIPPTLPYTIPTAFLFACTFVYGRLSANQEITALKASGISAMTIMSPAFVVASVLVAVSVWLTNTAIPQCHRWMGAKIMANVESNLYAYLRQRGALVKPGYDYEIYVKEVRDDKLINAVFKHRTEDGKYDFVAQAAEAKLNVIQPAVAGAEPIVHVQLIDYEAWSKSGSGRLPDKTYQMPLPTTFSDAEGKSKSFTYQDCLSRSQQSQDLAREADAYLAVSAASGVFQGDLYPFSDVIDANRRYAARQERKSREYLGEFHVRLTHSTAALAFALLGVPMGIWLQKRDFLHVFFVCFIPIITLYYPAMMLAQNVVKEGYVSPAVSLWTPTALMLLAAVPLFRRVLRY